jgi:hypothetical protein
VLDAILIQSQYACCDAQYACCTIFLAKWTLVLNPSDLEENYPYCICIYIAVESLYGPRLYPKYRVKFEGKLVPIVFSCRFLPYRVRTYVHM